MEKKEISKMANVESVESVKTKRDVYVDKVGCVAGKIWDMLSASQSKEMPITEIVQSLRSKTDEGKRETSVREADMALGWLSREGKIGFRRMGKRVVIVYIRS